jgi:uncharacterized membrane protein
MHTPRTTARRRGLQALGAAVVLAAVALVGPPPAGAEPEPDANCGNLVLRRGEFVPVDAPDGAASDPTATSYGGINDHGQIVGGYYEAGATRDATGFFPAEAQHAVLRSRRGRFTDLDRPGALTTLAYALNDRAQVVGQYIDRGEVPDEQGRYPADTVHGFVWQRGRFRTIDVPGAALTQPLGINNRGDVVGAYLEAGPGNDPYATGRLRGFVMRHGRFRSIDFPGAVGTKVAGINDRGQMVGYYDTEDNRRRGFLLSRGRFTRLDGPGAELTLPSGIDNRGRVVGAYLDPNGVNGRGFLWRNGRYTTIVAPGGRTDSVAIAINDRGEILIPADGTVYRLPERACGRPTVPAEPGLSDPAMSGPAMSGPAMSGPGATD